MSYVLTAFISMAFGAGLALLVRNSGNAAAEERAFKDGMECGYTEGYKAGDRGGYRVGIKRMSALRGNKVKPSPIEIVGDKITIDPKSYRVDVAPGFDSIRPEKRAENDTKEAAYD